MRAKSNLRKRAFGVHENRRAQVRLHRLMPSTPKRAEVFPPTKDWRAFPIFHKRLKPYLQPKIFFGAFQFSLVCMIPPHELFGFDDFDLVKFFQHKKIFIARDQVARPREDCGGKERIVGGIAKLRIIRQVRVYNANLVRMSEPFLPAAQNVRFNKTIQNFKVFTPDIVIQKKLQVALLPKTDDFPWNALRPQDAAQEHIGIHDHAPVQQTIFLRLRVVMLFYAGCASGEFLRRVDQHHLAF